MVLCLCFSCSAFILSLISFVPQTPVITAIFLVFKHHHACAALGPLYCLVFLPGMFFQLTFDGGLPFDFRSQLKCYLHLDLSLNGTSSDHLIGLMDNPSIILYEVTFTKVLRHNTYHLFLFLFISLSVLYFAQ